MDKPNAKTYSDNIIGAIILSILAPFISLLYSYKNKRTPWMKYVFWIAFSYTGLVFIYNPIGGTNADFIRYAEDFLYLATNDLSFWDFFNNYNKTGTSFDFAFPLLMYITSFFSDEPKYFFLLVSTIYGFFYSHNLWFVFERLPKKYNIYISILLVLFTLVVPFWGLARIWLAIQVFIFGILPFIVDNDKSKLIWIFLSPLIHFSAIFALGASIIYLFAPKKNVFLLVFFTISILINEVDLNAIRNIIDTYLPYLSDKASSYANEDYAEYRSSQTFSFQVVLARYIKQYGIITLSYLVFYCLRKGYSKNKKAIALFKYSIFMLSASNILALVPSGGRYISLSNFILLPSIIFILLNIDDKLVKQIYSTLSVVIIFTILFDIRLIIDYYGISLIIGNFFTGIFLNDNVPLIDYLK